MALDERDGALVSRVRGKRSACLEARKAEAPGESFCLRRLARNFSRRASAIAPRHRGVTLTGEIPSTLEHSDEITPGRQRILAGSPARPYHSHRVKREG